MGYELLLENVCVYIPIPSILAVCLCEVQGLLELSFTNYTYLVFHWMKKYATIIQLLNALMIGTIFSFSICQNLLKCLLML